MASKYISLTEKERGIILSALCSVRPVHTTLIRKIERSGERIKVRSAKSKGMGFQKWICEQLSTLLNIPFISGDDESLIASRNSGVNGVDIILRGEAKRKFPFSIEAKNCENLGIVDAVEQAKSNQAAGTDWMVVHKRKALKEVIVILSWDAFLKIWNK
jgi:hypothetical protein